MTGGRVTWARMSALADRLSDRDKEIVNALHQARVLTGQQLERLIFSNHPIANRAHIRRRVLNRLSHLDLISTLDRRIGGVRAGSSGLIYVLGKSGQRMADFLNGNTRTSRARSPHSPGPAFLSHALAVSEALVSLTEASRRTGALIRTFQVEPYCWWPDGLGNWLRPDAFVVIEDDRYEVSTWIEIDQGTESLTRIRNKLVTFERFGQSGQRPPDGLLPTVVFGSPDLKRTEEISREIVRYASTAMQFESVPQSQLATYVIGQLHS
ncbi:replication-relaxation family protein [Actinokineospora soli]|uniref:Replication-relaxation family protein n=1 Tax=Actinokineospora soli TaxID=1048753 RepID=A0ABW2TJ35_9PSEU